MKISQQPGSPPAPADEVAESTIVVEVEVADAAPSAHGESLLGDTRLRPQQQPSHDTGHPSTPNRTPWGDTVSSAGGADDKPREGMRLHHYELIRELGRGGMGSVYLARDTRLGRKVAIKFLHANNPELTQRFVQEARTTAQCSHENIVVIYEVGEFGQSPYMVLEYLQGDTLHRHLRKGEAVPVGRAVEWMVPVVRALAMAHSQGIVHRDLKPENIIITESGGLKVLDFGIAKVLNREGQQVEAANEARAVAAAKNLQHVANASPHDSNPGTEPGSGESGARTNMTRHGAILGTLAFMAPEQWRGAAEGSIDHRADLWAVGVMLFRLLSGRHPLYPLSGEQLYVVGVLEEPMPKLRDVAPHVPKALAEVVDRCLMKRKDQRFPDAASLLRALEPFLPGRYQAGAAELAENQSPYTGLSSFQESDAGRFFGRGREVAAAVHRIADRPLIAVVGPSGAGKSSFVRAGLVPALKRSGEQWDTVVLRPGRSPLAALASVVAPMIGDVTQSGQTAMTSVAQDAQAQSQLHERLRREPGYVGAVLRSRSRKQGQKILLFVDQFEELYTLVADPKERLAFTACLAGIADDATAPTRVVVSIRSDFLDRASEDQAFMAELSQGLFFLNAPDRQGLRDAITQPAELAGYKYQSAEMVEHMLDHLQSTPGALPLLQFAATKLWELRDPAKKLLTHESYERIGGIAGALASHADSVMAELSLEAAALARALFLRLVTPDRTRAIVSMEELRELSSDASAIQRLIDQLVQARLLVVQTGSVEIVHESLLQSWPTLRRWLDEGEEDLAFLDSLRSAAKQWVQKGQSADLLWRGEQVDEARRFQRRYRGELSSGQRAFLEAVFAQETRGARRRRRLAIAGVAFLSLLVAASAVALVVISRARATAQEQAVLAQVAEGQAKRAAQEAEDRLKQVQEKELARQAAAARAEQASKELQTKNAELIDALTRAESLRQRAVWAQRTSEKNAKAAATAREQALQAAQEIQSMLLRERERAKRLEDQLGSPMVETLE